MTQPRTRALYNGDCPICDAEMCHYAGYVQAKDLSIAFDDLNRTDLTAWGVTEDQAARVLHVLHDGRLHVGMAAFVVLWTQMPRYAWAARLARLPGVFGVLDWGYRRIAAPWLYRRHLRRKAS
jgi:predicted DCC family thiol-disulfide oxidoreductase YuxK